MKFRISYFKILLINANMLCIVIYYFTYTYIPLIIKY